MFANDLVAPLTEDSSMNCPDCGHDNIDGDDLCAACGQPLIQLDPKGSELEQTITKHTIAVLAPKKPVAVQASATAREAINDMVSHGIGCLIVERDGELVGIVTERDVLNKISEKLPLDQPVAEFMTVAPTTIDATESIAYALNTMDLGGYRHLPIVDDDGKAVGIISVRDILRFLCIRFAELRSDTK
jgi:CBS domain-containing protein